jgi:structural maintenance of chromosome 2
MQGRVTKIINNKPTEILSMVEEASGTSLYQTKRIAAFALLNKKEMKLKETDRIIEQDVQPQYAQLVTDKTNYDLFNKLEDDIAKKERVLLAFQFC